MVAAAVNLADVWSTEERAAWAPPERITPSQWAELHHVLPQRGTAEPGRYSLSRVPYMREPLDKLGDATTQEVILVKAVQVSGTETARAAIGYWVDTGDGSILCTLPNQRAAEQFLTERIRPMLDTPRLRRWVTGRFADIKQGQIDLAHTSIHAAWSGSPQTTASRAIRYAVTDETDKQQEHGREASTLDLVRGRFTTYQDRSKHFVLSSPTTSDGVIWSAFQATADKRYFHVPCPSCGASQKLVFEQVRWDGHEIEEETDDKRLERADRLLSGACTAWYECEHCHEPILERDRMAAVELGEWISVLGPNPVSVRVAYHISALYSPWVSFAKLVSEHLRSVVSGDTRGFRNSLLGLPSEDGPIRKHEEDVFTPRAKLHRAGIVPSWASFLTAGADTQARGGRPYWCWVVRAWGPKFRSRLIAAGKAYSPEELIRSTVDTRFAVEGGGFMEPPIVCVDSGGGAKLNEAQVDGNTTQLVYEAARRDPGRFIPVKGHGGQLRPDRLIRTTNTTYTPPGGSSPPIPVLLHVLDTGSLKDRLDALIYSEDATAWEESDCLPEGYAAQMTAEEKARVKLGRRSELRWIRKGLRSDWWDASVYALAGAHMIRADERALRHQQAPKPATPPTRPDDGRRRLSIDRTKSWISRR